MLRLIIVRPGSTDFDEQGRIKGTLDVPLNDSGTRQVSETAVSLHAENIEAIYTGPCRAAQQTAEQLAQRADVRFKVVDQLHNLDLGLWSGRRIEDLRQTQPRVYRQWQEHPETVCPPGGETLETAQCRLRKAVTRILKKHRHGTVAIVLSEPAASLVRSWLLATNVGDLWKAECECGKWDSIEIEPKAVALGWGWT
ncbi:MAG: histidine phosphatase family protein [Pirellulaceae bacterium]|nr:histidine phosphatase family protein [Planctomycetales bacterium]